PAPEPGLLGGPEPEEPPPPVEPEPSEPEAPVEPPVEVEPVEPPVEAEPAEAPVAVLAEPDPAPVAPQEAPEPPAPAPPTEALYAVVREAEALNLRSGPGTSFGVVRVAKLGEWLRASGEVRSGWQELELADGRRAWGSSRFLELKRVPLAVDASRPELDTGEGDAQRFPTLAAHDHETEWYERAFEINRLVDGALTAHVLSGLRLALKDPRPLNRAFALRGLRRYPRELLLGVGSQGLVEGLIEQLSEVHEAFVPKVAAELLGRLAGDDEARDAEGWQTWWREHGEAEARELARGPLPVPAALAADGGTRVRELSGAVSRVRKQGLDVVFLLDVTKSMGEELRTVKSQVREIVSLLSLLLDTKKVRLGFVAYGDEVVDWQYLIPPARFPERLDEVQIFDDPKDATIEEGISVALRATFDKRMRWGKSKRRRVVLLLADAPPLDPDLCRQIVQAAARQDFVLSSLIAEPPDYAKHKPADAILTELAKLGGGEVAPLSSPEELLVHILTLAFGPDYVQDLRLLVRAYRDVRPQRVE
ncbi:MAG: VWA domain-containing protein, partial [Planctomycetes bacterium]|nr:VWA domain-containing protein [Planctomycetota bacterium]